MQVQSGAFRQMVTLQSRPGGIPPAGTAGDESVDWATVGTFRAEVRALSGRELFQAAQVKAGVDYKIRMRNIGPIAPLANRFLYRGLILNPEFVQRDEEQSRFYVILASSLPVEDS